MYVPLHKTNQCRGVWNRNMELLVTLKLVETFLGDFKLNIKGMDNDFVTFVVRLVVYY